MTASHPPLDPMGIPSDRPDGLRIGLSKIWLGFILSLVVHAAIVLWAFGWLNFAPAPEPVEAVVVQVVPAEDLAEPIDQPEAEEAPETPPDAAETEEAVTEEEIAEPAPEEEAPPAPDATDPSQFEPIPEQPEAGGTTADAPPDLGRLEEGQGGDITQAEIDSLLDAIKRCWSVPTGWTDPRQVSVLVRFLLNDDGTLRAPPRVVEFRANPLGVEAAQNAARAVLECSPYSLPPEKYEQWKDVQVLLTP